jgi:hypothetical protein
VNFIGNRELSGECPKALFSVYLRKHPQRRRNSRLALGGVGKIGILSKK